MGLKSKLAELPGAAPFDGLDDAWHWSPSPMFHTAAALSADGEHVFLITLMDTYDEDLVRAVLKFAREHSAEFIAEKRPLTFVGGFRLPGWDFDTVAAAGPEVHGYYADQPDIGTVTFSVFPGYSSEFSGNEDAEEARGRFSKMLEPMNLKRAPVPFLKMRYDNTRTRSQSRGPSRGFTKPAVLVRELRNLQDAPGSFTEWENRHGEVWRAEWATALTLSGPGRDSGSRGIGMDELVEFAERSVTAADSGHAGT